MGLIHNISSIKSSFFLVLFVIVFVSPVSAATIITVDSTTDFAEADATLGREDSYTCTYTVGTGAIYKAAPNGVCTLRRAVLEAGIRPDSDRPITIEFDIPTNDSNYDSALGIWEVQIDSSYIWEIDRRFISDDGGQVTIDGGTRSGGVGPAIMINTNSDNNPTGGRSLEVRTSNNTFSNLGFHGGGQIILYEGGNLVEDVWMGLTNDGTDMKLSSTASSQAQRAMARGGIIMPNIDSDDNIIRNNRIIGAFERAIRVTSGGSGNLIEDNFIGMDADGDVNVAGAFDCSRALDYDSNLWYGGRGIQVTGSQNTVQNNTLAGLHVTQSANETPPISMEIYGTGNTVTGNIVGIDANDTKVGVCGQGLLFGGTESEASSNTFYFTRNGFEPNDIGDEPDSAIITQSFTGQGMGDPDRWLKVFNNVIDGGNETEANYHAYRLASPGVNEELRQFIPAKITSISGRTVRGTNGDKLFPISVEPFCPNCEIFLYHDDNDDRIESFTLLGQTRADANGDWVATINQDLVASRSIRTQSMSTDNQTFIADSVAPMRHYDANTTTRLSDDFYNTTNTPALNQNEMLTRRDMVKEILRALRITPAAATGNVYNDVGINDINADWIEEFHNRGFTEDCDTGKFCPDQIVTRAEMAKFFLKTFNMDNPSYMPPAAPGGFIDVDSGDLNEYWIAELANQSYTQGCNVNRFCPNEPVKRLWFESLINEYNSLL